MTSVGGTGIFLLNKIISAHVYSKNERYFVFPSLFVLPFFFCLLMCELLNTLHYQGLRLSCVGWAWKRYTSRMTEIDHFEFR